MALNIPGMQVLAQPVTAFYQGRAMRNAEKRAAQEGQLLDAQVERARLENDILRDPPVDQAKRMETAKAALTLMRDFEAQTLSGYEAKVAAGVTEEEAGAWAQEDFLAKRQIAKGLGLYEALGMDSRDDGELTWDKAAAVGAISTAESALKQMEPKAPPKDRTIKRGDKEVLQEYNPQTRKWEDRETAARWQPDKAGLSVTLPDGTVIAQGSPPAIGAGDLTTPVKTKLQESIVGATDELDRLNSIGEQFNPEFLQLPGKAKAIGLKIKDLAGGALGDLSSDQQKYLTEYSTFVADAAKNLSSILNRLSGAAISPAEAERLKKGIPNDQDSPTQFAAKYKAAVKDVTRATMRANWALTQGIGVKSTDNLSKMMPLSAIDQVYETRANEIWQSLGGTPETKAQAVKQANQEFGLAR
jgi:hypothetical protein